MTELSDYLKVMNEAGFFLQMRVAKEARQRFDRVIEEVAFEHGGRPAKLDVLAEKRLFQNVRGFFLIECKRHLPDYKSWIFLTPEVKRERPPYLLGFGEFHSSIILEEFYQPPAPTMFQSATNPILALLMRGFPHLTFELGYIGLEVRLSQSKYVMEQLTGVCKDVVTATHGMAMEIEKRSRTDKTTFEEPVLFFPVVITTANLFTAKADIAKIALGDGKLAEDGFELRPVPWLVYEYSLTADLLLPVNLGSETWNSSREDRLRRRHILIANSEHLGDFLKNLADS